MKQNNKEARMKARYLILLVLLFGSVIFIGCNQSGDYRLVQMENGQYVIQKYSVDYYMSIFGSWYELRTGGRNYRFDNKEAACETLQMLKVLRQAEIDSHSMKKVVDCND